MSVLNLDERRTETAPTQETAQPEPVDTAHRQSPRGGRRVLRFTAIAVLLLAGLAALGMWLMDRWSHAYVSDSRIAANVVTVSSEAAGRVTAVPIVAGDRISQGDLLVRLETRQAELAIQELDAEIARIEAEQSQLRARQAMIQNRTESRTEAGRAQVEAAEAEHEGAQAELATSRSDYERAKELRDRGVVSAQRFEEARAKFLSAKQQELRTAAGVKSARADLAVIEADAAEIEVLERQIAALEAQKSAQTARREQARVDLAEREVRAAFDGVIDATFIDVGEYVAPGSRLLMYHDPSTVWVDANVKETEFGRLAIGAPATVTVDAYPDRTFKGEVVRLGQAATSQFALLPSPNPSGNFTKVTQRLPVRIAIKQQEGLLRPGMMVEVEIDVVD